MIQLYEHQKEALRRLANRRAYALFLEQGTGKTIIMLSHMARLIKAGLIRNALVVAPKSAMGAWERDTEKFDAEDREAITEAMTVINYDRVWRNGFDKREFDMIILDEAHYIKNRASRRTKACLRLGANARYRYILTGTPISNGQLENIWSEYCFLDCYFSKGYPKSRMWGGGYSVFTRKYCILNAYYQPCEYRNVAELQKTIERYSYRVTKAECLDLPEKLPDEIVYVEMSKRQRKLYEMMAKDSAIPEMDILADNPLARLLRLRQISSGFIAGENGTAEDISDEKKRTLTEIIEGFPDDKKIVIFAEFKRSIKAIEETLAKAGISYVTLDGDQPNKTIWRKYQSDPSIRAIVCQYQTANAGIDLYASDTIIYYEPTLRSTVLEQSRDRIHRTGQTNKCSYIHLITANSIEEVIYQTLAEYGDFNKKLFTQYIDAYRRGRR